VFHHIDILPRLKAPPEIGDFWCTNETFGLVNAGIPTAVGILGFAVHDLLSWGQTALTTVEQVNRWLCQPAVIPIVAPRTLCVLVCGRDA